MNIVELFKKLTPLDLDEKETAVLASLFLHGTRSVTQISESADLKRPHAYNILRALQGKGLAFELVKNKVRHYSPPKPHDLLNYLALKKESLNKASEKIEDLIPTLAKLIQPAAKKPQIRFFWGVDGLLSIYQETLSCEEKVIYAFCDFQKVFPEDKDPQLNRWMWDYAKKRAKAGIVYRGILNRSRVSDMAAAKAGAHLRELKVINDVDLPLEINIYDRKVAFMSSGLNFMGIVIEDEAIAKMLRNIHQLLWRTLPNYNLPPA